MAENETIVFPNGFRCWMETHHEVVCYMTWFESEKKQSPVIDAARDSQGSAGLYDLAEKITNEFEELNKGREWDGEFYEEIEQFVDKKLNDESL